MIGAPGIRELTPDDHDTGLQILRELRPALDKATLIRHLAAQPGYRLIGAFTPMLSGLLGMRVVETLARGRFMHLDDVVVAAVSRGQGIGRALMSHAEAEARRVGCVSVFLDSYENVLPFYRALGYAPLGSMLVHKRLT